MVYTTEQISDDKHILSYRFFKSDSKETLFLFHGFGQTNVVFDLFVASVFRYYSVIAIDLLFHGESVIKKNRVDYVSIEKWNKMFNKIVIKHDIDRFSFLSYSMGSRFVVTILKIHAARINKIALIAPDGFGNNFWFRVATSTKLTRFAFRFTMNHPSCLRFIVRVLGTVGLFNSITKRFIERNLESAEHRKKIYNSWVYFRKLVIGKKDFVEIINKNKISLMCYCGKEDQLVARKSLRLICDETSSHYIELDLAHHKMIQALELTELADFLIADG